MASEEREGRDFTLFAIVVLLIGIGFMAGLLAGKRIYANSEDSSCTINSSQKQTPDWGADVTGGGKAVPVVQWLDTELQPDNIRENLRWLYIPRYRALLRACAILELSVIVWTPQLQWFCGLT